MSREIPFFELFAQLQLSPELRLKLLGAVIASACIHQDTLSMELAMIVKHPLEPSDLDELNSAIRNGYGLNEVRFRVSSAFFSSKFSSRSFKSWQKPMPAMRSWKLLIGE